MLRVAFALLLYLFLFRLVGAIRRDLARAARAGSDERRPARRRSEARLIVIEGSSAGLESGHSIPIPSEALVGRTPESDVRLDDGQVSSEHARLRKVSGRWQIEDLDSTNGTFLNQQAVLRAEMVEYGDIIEIGGVRFKLAQ